ncbi:MAG: hypothetical protein AAB553_05845 [Patescibacteria group bacterium]
MNTNEMKKWYTKTGGIIAMLFLFYPVGLILMWKHAQWNKAVKWIVTIVFVLYVFTVATSSSENKSPQTASKSDVTPTVSKKPVAKQKIVVSSMIVKKIAPETYRYFFNIENQESKDFNGEVYIQLYNGHEEPGFLIFGGATKSFADSPVRAGANSVSYIDDSHAPFEVSGIDGAMTFSYSVSVGDDTVATGKGGISGEYENYVQE